MGFSFGIICALNGRFAQRLDLVLPKINFQCDLRSFSRIVQASNLKKPSIDQLLSIPIERIRNWAVIAHVDHGKSTLSDRLLELTGTIDSREKHQQFLDKLQVEQQRGITVKAQSVSMIYCYKNDNYLLNLIDTPGHVDFQSEVAQSLAASQGCVLLIDATQGIQAQTVSNYDLARKKKLRIIPVLNKIDLITADVDNVILDVHDRFSFEPEECLKVSAKTGVGVKDVIDRVCEYIPPPIGKMSSPLKLFLIDSWHDKYFGVILLVCICDGFCRKNDVICSSHNGKGYEIQEVGFLFPDRVSAFQLSAGQVGYVICGMKNLSDAFIGDTFYRLHNKVEPLPGLQAIKPMVYVGAFPTIALNYNKVNESIQKLLLNDRSIIISKEQSAALGLGWRIGLAGSLHLSVFVDRLRDEHASEVIITTPTVPYKVIFKDGTERLVKSVKEFPDEFERSQKVMRFEEPIVEAKIIVPESYIGKVVQLCEENRGKQISLDYISQSQVSIKYFLPLFALIEDIFSRLKSETKGYATLDYQEAGYRAADLVKLTMLLNKEPVDTLCTVLHRSQAMIKGRNWAEKLKQIFNRQQFDIIIQASVGNKIVARETLKAYRKDVSAKLYGGDWTRRLKLLEKQREGKKNLQTFGVVRVDSKTLQKFYSIQ